MEDRPRDDGAVPTTDDTLEKEIRSVISRFVDIPTDDIMGQDRLMEDLGADSFNLLQIRLELERVFSTQFPVERLDELLTVPGILRLVKSSHES